MFSRYLLYISEDEKPAVLFLLFLQISNLCPAI